MLNFGIQVKTLHARKQVVDMKNTLGGQFYFFQARRGGPNEGPARHSSEALNVQVVPAQ